MVTLKNIQEDIKTNQFKKLYLFYGEEAYLKKQYRDNLKKALTQSEDTMNYHYFQGKNVPVGQIIDLSETLPFLAERRVIFIEDSGLFKSGGEQLSDYLKEIPDSTCFCFIETEVDKRSKLFKVLRDEGRVVEFVTPQEADLKRWILGFVKKEGKQISESTLLLFLSKTGNDMETIRQELEKLFCYTLQKDQIEKDDIEAICSSRISNHIFDMINHIAEKNQKMALTLYYDLLSLKEPPLRILFLIARQFNLLLQVKELKQKGYDDKLMSEKTGLQSFVVRKYVQQAGRFHKKELLNAVQSCVMAEEAVKTGKINDLISVELLIVKYSS